LTVVSQTSTSELRELKSAEPLAVKKKPAEDANRDLTHGKFTCAVRPTRSTTRPACRWHKESSLTCNKKAPEKGLFFDFIWACLRLTARLGAARGSPPPGCSLISFCTNARVREISHRKKDNRCHPSRGAHSKIEAPH